MRLSDVGKLRPRSVNLCCGSVPGASQARTGRGQPRPGLPAAAARPGCSQPEAARRAAAQPAAATARPAALAQPSRCARPFLSTCRVLGQACSVSDSHQRAVLCKAVQRATVCLAFQTKARRKGTQQATNVIPALPRVLSGVVSQAVAGSKNLFRAGDLGLAQRLLAAEQRPTELSQCLHPDACACRGRRLSQGHCALDTRPARDSGGPATAARAFFCSCLMVQASLDVTQACRRARSMSLTQAAYAPHTMSCAKASADRQRLHVSPDQHLL